VNVDMKKLGLVKENDHNCDRWSILTTEKRPTLPQCSNEGVINTNCVLEMLNVNEDEMLNVLKPRQTISNNICVILFLIEKTMQLLKLF